MDILNESLARNRTKASEKLGTIFSGADFLAPDRTVIEQASGSETAQYAASLTEDGCTIADLTGGLGVNTFYFSKKARKVYCVEIEEKRANALTKNFSTSGIENIEVINADCLNWLNSNQLEFDTVFIDPSRRGTGDKRIARLDECSPNIDLLLPVLENRCKKILVKVSPLQDIHFLFSKYPDLQTVHILESHREVKELLLEFIFSGRKAKSIKCVWVRPDDSPEILNFPLSLPDTRIAIAKQLDEIKDGGYIYEPSPALMKSGRHNYTASRYPGMMKLAANTHLYYSETYIRDFPGRIFRMEGHLTSKDLKKLKGKECHVISRNHPAKAPELEQRYKLKPSGDRFLILCRVGEHKTILETVKINKLKK